MVLRRRMSYLSKQIDTDPFGEIGVHASEICRFEETAEMGVFDSAAGRETALAVARSFTKERKLEHIDMLF